MPCSIPIMDLCFRLRLIHEINMSFILDALKKSEREREQHAQGIQPGVVYRRPHTPPIWMIVVIGLLLLNMALVAAMWTKNNQAAGPLITVNNAAPVASPSPAISAKEPASGEAKSLQSAATSQTEVPDETARVLADAPVPDGPPLVKQITPEDAAKSGVSSSISTFPKTTTSGVQTLDSIGGAAALNLPQLHLDIHVYSLKDTERFVFINMKKYAEGQTLKEGPVLEHITPDGAVLQYQNQEFLLPRQ